MKKPAISPAVKDSLAWMLIVPATMLSLAAGLRFLLKLWRSRLPWKPTILPPDLDELEGLTDEAAASRRTYDRDDEHRRARKKIIRAILQRNLVSIFNLSLLGLATATAWLGDWLGALTTLGVLLANIVVNTVQQAFAVYNVDKIAAQSRPKVNAIRSGQSKGIRVDEIVVGDVLVVGLGDQILADGLILRAAGNLIVEGTALAGHGEKANKLPGDALWAGSYCVQGWAAYEVQARPPEELRGPQLNAIPATRADLTPLQKVIDHLLRILLVLMGIFVFMLVHSFLRWDVVPLEAQKIYRDIASIVFSIAPSGLFFMIVVAYNMGTFDLLKLGALVRDARSVESLAQVTTICFGKSGTLTGIDIQIEMLPQADDISALGESRVRQIIGDFAYNSSTSSPFLSEMQKKFEGQPRPINREAPYLSTYGWSALTFSDPDLQGTYVVGQPDLFQVKISKDKEESDETGDAEQHDSVVQKTWGRLRGIFKRDETQPEPKGAAISGEPSQPETEAESPVEGGDSSKSKEEHPGIFQRLRSRVSSAVRRETSPDEVEFEAPIIEPTQLVFAYSPEEKPLFNDFGRPALPEDLVPLSCLTFTEQVRPEAREAIEIFTDAGVRVNIISQQNAREVLAAARQLGLEEMQPGGLKTLSGSEIKAMPADQLTHAVKEAAIFAPVTPQQKGKIISLLRASGEYVAMTGEGLSDIEAMRQANLSITIQGNTQAAVSFADIILLKDSLQALPRVLKQGRRIVNGLVDVLKLNLVQVAYIFFLLIAMIVTRNRLFFYDPSQGGVIVFFTIVIPSLSLTFFAPSGAISGKKILSQLLRFILPAGLTTALASLAVYFSFEHLTGNQGYAQLGVTYILSLTGMLMVFFIKPPNKFWVGESYLSGDKRIVWIVMGMFILFGVVQFIPLAQRFLKVAPLQQTEHYLIIAGVLFAWVVLTKLIWLLPGMRLSTPPPSTLGQSSYP